MASSRTDLLDANLWLALGLADHPFHQRARRYWFEEAGDRVAFCRITALGFLRLCCHPVVMAGAPMTIPEAWDAYRNFRSLPEVDLLAEPAGCEPLLETWASAGTFTLTLWTDAYLAAFANAGDLRLVSFDADFGRFEGVEVLLLRE